MSRSVLLDTGIVSRHVAGNHPAISDRIAEIGKKNCFISIVSRVELHNWLSGYQTLDKAERARFLRDIRDFTVLHLNREISRTALGYTDLDFSAKPADLLIGATAYHYGFPLLTLNTKDFARLGVEMA